MRSDEELMLAYKAGDRPAFDELVRRHWSGVEGLLRKLLRDGSQVDGAVVECFYKLHRAAAAYEPRARFTTFLYGLVYHEAVNTHRLASRKSATVVVPFARDSLLESRQPSALASPEATLMARQDLQALDRAVAALPEVQRAAFVLYYREDMATPEIAETLGIPVGSVRAYLSTARRALREALSDRDREQEPPVVTRRGSR